MTTLDHLLEPAARQRVPDAASYSFCPNASCDAVYFAPGAPTFHQTDLTVRVGLKVCEDPIPVCYCFGFTEGHIAEQIRQTGCSTVAAEVGAKVKAGKCECETKNPQGSCCLGNIAVATRRILAGLASSGNTDVLRAP